MFAKPSAAQPAAATERAVIPAKAGTECDSLPAYGFPLPRFRGAARQTGMITLSMKTTQVASYVEVPLGVLCGAGSRRLILQ